MEAKRWSVGSSFEETPGSSPSLLLVIIRLLIIARLPLASSCAIDCIDLQLDTRQLLLYLLLFFLLSLILFIVILRDELLLLVLLLLVPLALFLHLHALDLEHLPLHGL